MCDSNAATPDTSTCTSACTPSCAQGSQNQFACMAVGDFRVLQHRGVVVANRASLKRVAKPLPTRDIPACKCVPFYGASNQDPCHLLFLTVARAPSAHISSSSTHAAFASTPHVGGGHSDSVWVCLCLTAVLSPHCPHEPHP